MSPIQMGIQGAVGICLLWVAFHEDSPAFQLINRFAQRLAMWFWGF